MSKYGLNLRAPPEKRPAKPPLPAVLGFGNDNDDDVEKEISRHAFKNKSLRDIEELQKKALEEDPSAFDYDGVYDVMKAKTVLPKAIDREERKPRYIENLIKKADQRKKEQDIVYERKLAKERSQEDHLYADKDKFVTSAYKKKLAEQAKWMEEERLRQRREEKDDVTKKTDLSDFYFNLGKNVAFGAKDVEVRKPEKPDKPEDIRPAETSNKNRPKSPRESLSLPAREENRIETSLRQISPEPADAKPVSESKAHESSPVEQQPKPHTATNHHKRSEDALAAAKERFLARKRAKEQ